MENSQLYIKLKEIQSCGNKNHVIEAKNDYKDYPCPTCGATDNRDGSKCWQVKIKKLMEEIKSSLTNPL